MGGKKEGAVLCLHKEERAQSGREGKCVEVKGVAREQIEKGGGRSKQPQGSLKATTNTWAQLSPTSTICYPISSPYHYRCHFKSGNHISARKLTISKVLFLLTAVNEFLSVFQ